ncbi:MAG: AAA family ATPase [Actinobacteria bacterium]|nr:AAA family ATPase [Actinomycetota bacterium]
MTVCVRCGHQNRAEARFCDSCGAPVEGPTEPQERRKLATLLFCDMSGSTAMGERVDAESVRDLMFAYFHEMRGAIERHGGTVEKFIGDAVMAVFGVPTAHEDDALRAVRAAWEMQERLERLNAELEQRFGSKIALRIGVNTGEVVAGDATLRQALVTGDAVNVAARLEQAASPGEILIGEATFRLVRDAVSAEPVAPLELKGKSEPLPAYRLTHVEAEAPARARRLDTPMVGRDTEIAVLSEKLAEAASGRCILATVVGEPGVGKSRLAAELVSRAQDQFRILTGRCLPYGEGISYWPIAEIVRQAAEIRDEHSRDEALARIGTIVPGDDAHVVAQAIGLVEGHASTDEIAGALRELIRALAGRQPLLLLVDDIHWGDEVLLDFLTRLPHALVDAPVLVLCLARRELIEEHPAWDATLRLDPLDESSSNRLVEQLFGGEAALPKGLAARVADAASGNPLFVEELAGMLIDDGLLARDDGGWVVTRDLADVTIPATLRELLGARLDRLPAGERSALERGAVEGQVFHRGAVIDLSEERNRATAPAALHSLAEREYLRATRADFVDEAAFRVRHILIRDAAYEAIPKKVRASLHERFADWLESKAGDRAAEYDEILGYHLEQAYRYRTELGPTADADRTTAMRAAEKLERAGLRALHRRDSRATTQLLSRAAALLPDESETRLELLQFTAEELGYMGEFDRSLETANVVLEGARARDDDLLAARARLIGSLMRLWIEPEFGVREMLAAIDEVQSVFETFEYTPGIARAHDMRALTYIHMGRFQAAQREAERAIEGFRRLADRRLEVEQLWYLGWTAAYGPMPVADGLVQCHRILDEAGDDVGVDGHTHYSLARLEAKNGCFDVARELADHALAVFEDTGMLFSAWHPLCRGEIELLAGDASAAERDLRRAIDLAEALSIFPDLANATSLLGNLLVEQGRIDEAEALASRAEKWSPKDQPIEHSRWRAVRARVLARRGDAGAETLAREAVALAEQTDFLELQGDCLLALADVLRFADRDRDATVALDQALVLYERKGNVVLAARARTLLAEVSSAR